MTERQPPTGPHSISAQSIQSIHSMMKFIGDSVQLLLMDDRNGGVFLVDSIVTNRNLMTIIDFATHTASGLGSFGHRGMTF